jgi:hypothetical protein
MVENRPGHEEAQHADDRHRNPTPDGANDAQAETDRDADTETAAQAVALHAEELRDSAAAEDRRDDAIDAEPLPDPASAYPESRFASASREADEPARSFGAEPRRPGIAATMLPPILAVAIAAAVVVGAAKTGLLPESLSSTSVGAPQGDPAAIEALKARIASLEARPAPNVTEPAATTIAGPDPALTGKVEALEKTVATLRDDLATLRTQSDQLASAVKDIKAAPSEPAPAANANAAADRSAADTPANDSAAALAAINARLTELEATAKAAIKSPTDAAPQPPTPAAAADDAPLRRLVTATMLDLTVKQGAPYAPILKAAESLATDPAALKPLAPFAATGVPSAAALGRELAALLPKLLAGEDAAGTPNFIDRFQANAERLIRIQRSDAVAGIDRTAMVGRLTAAAQRGDLAEARRELKALAPADRAPVQSWIDKSEARDQALDASQSFATAALAALPKPTP